MKLAFLFPFRDSDMHRERGLIEALSNDIKKVARADTEVEIFGLPEDIFDLSEGIYFYAHPKVTTGMIYRAKKAEKQGFDGIIIGEVGAVDAEYSLKEILNIPVVGASESSFLLALLLGVNFSLLTYGDKAYAWLYRTVREYGLEHKCVSIRQADISDDELLGRESIEKICRVILEKANQAIKEDRAEVLLLASVGFAGLADYLRKRVSVPVVDPVEAAVKFAEMLVDLNKSKGLLHSKVLSYKPSPNVDRILKT